MKEEITSEKTSIAFILTYKEDYVNKNFFKNSQFFTQNPLKKVLNWDKIKNTDNKMGKNG